MAKERYLTGNITTSFNEASQEIEVTVATNENWDLAKAGLAAAASFDDLLNCADIAQYPFYEEFHEPAGSHTFAVPLVEVAGDSVQSGDKLYLVILAEVICRGEPSLSGPWTESQQFGRKLLPGTTGRVSARG